MGFFAIPRKEGLVSKFIEAIDTRNGKKVRIPTQWVDLFPHFKTRKHHRPAAQIAEPKPPQTPTIKHETKEP